MNFSEFLFLTWVISIAVILIFNLMLKTHKDEIKNDELNSIIKYNTAVKIVMYIAPLTFAVIGIFASILDYQHKSPQLPLSLTITTVFTILEVITVKYFHSFTIVLKSDCLFRRVFLFKDKIIYWKDINQVKYNNISKSIKIKDIIGNTISISTDSMNGINAIYKAFINNLDSSNPIHEEIIKKYSGYI